MLSARMSFGSSCIIRKACQHTSSARLESAPPDKPSTTLRSPCGAACQPNQRFEWQRRPRTALRADADRNGFWLSGWGVFRLFVRPLCARSVYGDQSGCGQPAWKTAAAAFPRGYRRCANAGLTAEYCLRRGFARPQEAYAQIARELPRIDRRVSGFRRQALARAGRRG
jgi:hypothetical protein